jgi:cell division protein FtsA
MSRSLIVGIDIGTYETRVMIALLKPHGATSIVALGRAETRGMRHGYATNVHEVARSIRAALNDAEQKGKVKVQRGYVAIGGIGLSSVVVHGSTVVTRGDLVITAIDIEKAHAEAEKNIPPSAGQNRKIIHTIPIEYKIDERVVLGAQPEGMKGHKLEVKMHFITCLEHHVADIIQAVEEAGVEVLDVMAAPLAASLVSLTKAQKVAGCVLANIGAETLSIAVFENNFPISLEVFPIGSTDITNDIALGLKVSLEEAEHIKIGAMTGTAFPRKKLEDIMGARLHDMFELIDAHLKKLNRNGLLPAGIIITGGGAGLGHIDDIAKVALRLPARIGMHRPDSAVARDIFRDATWAVSHGLIIFGGSADALPPLSSGFRFLSTRWRAAMARLKHFLP